MLLLRAGRTPACPYAIVAFAVLTYCIEIIIKQKLSRGVLPPLLIGFLQNREARLGARTRHKIHPLVIMTVER